MYTTMWVGRGSEEGCRVPSKCRDFSGSGWGKDADVCEHGSLGKQACSVRYGCVAEAGMAGGEVVARTDWRDFL